MTQQLAIVAALLAGFFGSTHCIGMCSAVVVLFESSAAKSADSGAWLRRLSYNTGRLFFYALLGAIAGIGGAVLTKTVGVSQGLMLLRLLAAALVIAIGLNLMFDWRLTRFLETAGSGIWKKISPLAKHVLPADTFARSLSAGFLWGALPCGLVYSAVAIAATTGSLAGGASIMFAFWLGTLPAMLMVGASAHTVNRLKTRPTFRRLAGFVVILIGIAALIPFGSSSNQHHDHAAEQLSLNLETTSLCLHVVRI